MHFRNFNETVLTSIISIFGPSYNDVTSSMLVSDSAVGHLINCHQHDKRVSEKFSETHLVFTSPQSMNLLFFIAQELLITKTMSPTSHTCPASKLGPAWKPDKISVNSALFLLILHLHNSNYHMMHMLYITSLIFYWQFTSQE